MKQKGTIASRLAPKKTLMKCVVRNQDRTRAIVIKEEVVNEGPKNQLKLF